MYPIESTFWGRGWLNVIVMPISYIQTLIPLSPLSVIINGTTFSYIVTAS